MNTLRKLLYLAAVITILDACNKTETSPTHSSSTTLSQSSTAQLLEGDWTIAKYIATEFDTVAGPVPFPDDTIYPGNTEYVRFTGDSVYSRTWEPFIYSWSQPDSFYGFQGGVELQNSCAFTATSSYYVEPCVGSNDTSYIISLSDTLLVTMMKIYATTGTSGPALFHLYRYARR